MSYEFENSTKAIVNGRAYLQCVLNTAYLIYTFKKSERRMETNDAQV